ncbi:hypothetical protein OHAE_1066 [Ochrobactrum soli]|uniref:Uncharacterized protein n=1 Tax=Ochrobactrum soli TaxID=2448455 RepID=A0A2P9HMB8_9HYPH|nr:hypothetical protein OHAE_1066 [[Ochrobactrum] soli]
MHSPSRSNNIELVAPNSDASAFMCASMRNCPPDPLHATHETVVQNYG